MTAHIEAMRNHLFYVADTTPPMAVHPTCAGPKLKLTPRIMKGEFVCFICHQLIRERSRRHRVA